MADAASTLGDLPDVNVWLALALPTHVHHAAAARWWHSAAAQKVAFCRVTALGLLRLLCQPKVTGLDWLTPARACEQYQQFRTLPEVSFAQEPLTCEAAFMRLANHGSLPARLLTDAYLAAFAQSSKLRLVSFDSDFARFEQLNWLNLSAPRP